MSMKMAAKQEAPRASRMTLGAVVKGKIAKPPRVLIYGVEGVGKSTFAAAAPSPIFLGAEDGTSELDTARFPEPKTWRDVLDAIAVLTHEPHDYQTLAIDTLDWLEPLCWSHTCSSRRDKNGRAYESIEDFGFAKGYVYALDGWRQMLAALDAMRARRGMGIVLLAHSWVKAFKNPVDEDYDRYELKLHAKAGGLIKEWSDEVLFASYETYSHKKDGRVRGVSTGARVLYTQRTAAWDAKNRHDLPEMLPLSWEAFADALVAHTPAPAGSIEAAILGMLTDGVSDDIRTRVRNAVKEASGDAARLAKIKDRLQAMKSIETKDQITKEV
jgi:hypothetical protein